MRTARTAIVLLMLAAVGCERDEIRTYSVEREQPGPALADAPNEPSTAPAARSASWTVPPGWTQLPDAPQRVAGFSVSADDPQALVTLTVLQRQYPLIDDVNRWQIQLGMPATGSDSLATVSRQAEISGRTVTFVDLHGPPPADAAAAPATGDAPAAQRRMLVAIIPTAGQRWYAKFTGNAATINAQAQPFLGFVSSLQLPEAAAAQPAPAAQAPRPPLAPPSDPALQEALAAEPMELHGYQAPDGWTVDPPKPMRELSLIAPAGGPAAEIIVSRLSRQFGSLSDNINRWRGQVGLPPLAEADMPTPEPLRIAGGQHAAAGYDFTGPATEQSPARRMRVVYGVVGPEVWFFKLQGSADGVEQHTAAFTAFLDSLKFEPVAHDHDHNSTTQPASPH